MENQNQNQHDELETQNQLDTTTEVEQDGPSINQEKLEKYLESLKAEQNFPMGLAAGLVAALVGSVLWAVITVGTGYQIGYMAIAVGFMVGMAMRYTGKGLDNHFGISGAILAFLGCLVGNFLSVIGFVGKEFTMAYSEVFSTIPFGSLVELMVETSSPIDILLYGFAIYQGYQFAFRQITEEEIMANAVDHPQE